MIKIENNKSFLYQWDLNMRVELLNIKQGTEVHFSDTYITSDNCLVVESYEQNNKVFANIPNILLQRSGIILVYFYIQDEGRAWTEFKTEIVVLPRKKPANYVYTETEALTYKKLEAKLDQTKGQIGNLEDLATKSKDNLVAAVNEVKRTTDSKQNTLIQSGASVGQIVKISAVDDTGKPTAWEAINIPEQAQPDWNQNNDTQPDYVKNKPFYLEKTLFIELTKDDFTVNNQDGYIEYMYRSTPKLDWFISAESIAFEIELVDINGSRYMATQDSLDVSVKNDTTDDDYEYWTYYSNLFDIVSGVDLDFYDDEYYYKDEWGVLVNHKGIELSEINIKIYRVDVKKIPEICLDAAIGKTAITVGEVLYGSEGEIPTNVVVPDLSIPITPGGANEDIYYDRIYGQLRISGDLLPYEGIVDYTFDQPIPTTAGSYISFDISSEGDTLWDTIGWNSPWNFGRYLTFMLHSYYMDAGEVTAGGKIEFLSRGDNSILAGTAVAVSSSGYLYTVVLKYTNNYKTLNVTIKCVA